MNSFDKTQQKTLQSILLYIFNICYACFSALTRNRHLVSLPGKIISYNLYRAHAQTVPTSSLHCIALQCLFVRKLPASKPTLLTATQPQKQIHHPSSTLPFLLLKNSSCLMLPKTTKDHQLPLFNPFPSKVYIMSLKAITYLTRNSHYLDNYFPNIFGISTANKVCIL